jgi:ribosomal protein S18 acetylase RimI-like enzyme
MTTIELRAITKENWRDIIVLDIHPDQYRFLHAHMGLYALAKAYVYPERDHLAICADGRPVGFFSVEYNLDPPSSCNIYTFFVDWHYQRCGHGRAAMAAFLQTAPARYPQALSVDLVVASDNEAAVRMYASVGFQKIGKSASAGNEWMVYRLPPSPAFAEGSP